MIPQHRSRRLTASVAAAAIAGILLGACGNENSAGCVSAAEAQAHAESAWGEALQAHNTAHTEANEHDAHDELTALTVSLIIAEAETRSACP